MDLFLVVQSESDGSFFPPAISLKYNSFTPSGDKFTQYSLDRHILIWKASTEDNLSDVANWILQTPNMKDVYIGQAFDSSSAHGRYLNCQLLHEVLKRRSEQNTFFVIRDAKDKELLCSLSDLQERLQQKLKVKSISEKAEFKLVFLPKKPQPAPALLPSKSLPEADILPEERKASSRPSISRQHSDIPSPLLGSFQPQEEAKTLPVQRIFDSMCRVDPQNARVASSASSPKAVFPISQAQPRPNPQQSAANAVADIASLSTVPQSHPHSSEVQPPPHPDGQSEAEFKFQEEDLRCIVCLGIFQGSLTTDCCGAVICKDCAPNLNNRCPQCRKISRFIENKALNRILSGLKEYCSCKQEVTARTKAEHMKVCPNRNFYCPKCKDQPYKKEEFKQHLKNAHMKEILIRMDRYQLI